MLSPKANKEIDYHKKKTCQKKVSDGNALAGLTIGSHRKLDNAVIIERALGEV